MRNNGTPICAKLILVFEIVLCCIISAHAVILHFHNVLSNGLFDT